MSDSDSEKIIKLERDKVYDLVEIQKKLAEGNCIEVET